MTAAGEPGGGGRRPAAAARPRNYLAAADRRRLFWTVMPVAAALLLGLGWLERTWLPPEANRRTDEIDTRLDAVVGPPPAGEEVLIHRDPPPLDAASGLAATPEALARVRDATFFRTADEDAWFQTWQTLRATGIAGLRRSTPRRVTFRELFGQPRSFRGRLVVMRGTLRRLEELTAPANSSGIDRYWQGWLEPAGGPSSPVVVQSLGLPAGMPTGMSIDEPVEVVGYFFKNYAYNATDTIRVAPVIMTVEPIRRTQPAVPAGGGAVSTIVTALLAATLVSLIGVAWLGSRAGRRPPTGPARVDDLDATLASWEGDDRPGRREDGGVT